MVYAGIPNHYTGSPSSYVAPSLTINHEATVDLDSTNAFEGQSIQAFFSTFKFDDYRC